MGCGHHKNGLVWVFFPGWTLKLNMSDSLRESSYSLLATLMETRLRFSAPQQKGQRRGLGKNANVDLMVLCFRDAVVQGRALGLAFLLFFFYFPCIQ